MTYIIAEGAFSGVSDFDYNSDLNVRQSVISAAAITNPTSKDFAYGMWLNVNKLQATNMIFHRQHEMKMMIDGGSMKIKVRNLDYNLINYYPLHKWVYLIVNVGYNEKLSVSIIDFYIDGKMVKSIQINPYINPVKTEPITLGTLDAKMIDFKRWTYKLSPQMILDEYNNSTMKKYLGGYKINIDILKNDVMAKKISLV